jgi:HEAT repeats
MDAQAFASGALERLAMQAARDLVVRSARMVDFDKFCERLPAAARSLSGEERAPAVAGILLGLASVTEPRWAELANKALTQITRSGVSALAIRAAEKLAGRGEDAQVDDVMLLARLVCAHNPEPVLDLLERADSRKMRRALIDVITAAGPDLLPSVQTRLQSSQWFVTRNMVILHVRLGGDARELRTLAEHPHVQVRVEVVRQLRSLARDPAACEIVAGCLADRSGDVVQAAIASLATMDLPASVVGALEALASDEQRGDEARQAAVRVLGRSRNEVAPEALVRLLQPHGLIERPATSAIRDEAARALRTSPAPTAPARFEEALRSSAWRVRKACERAMGQEQDHG